MPRNIKFDPPYFMGYIYPNGNLDSFPETHALWNYYLAARGTYERTVVDPLVLEGQKDPVGNYRQLFESIATMYGVTPSQMAKCWQMIDNQCDYLRLPKLPNEERYRFDRIDIIRTH